MISVEEALDKVLSCVEVLGREEKPILECLGQVLDEDVYSSIDVPPLDNAAMDGYAIKAESILGASESSPRFLDVIGEVSAGAISEQEVRPGTALRIMTGAPLPGGADSVVRFEDTDEARRSQRPLTQIGILKQIPQGRNVRRAAEDISRGQLVLAKGISLRPVEIGVLASLGKSTVAVIRRPVVAILATGDELVEIDQPLPAGKIYNSNTFGIAAQVSRYGGMPKILGIARDRVEEIEAKVKQALDSDMLITSGGVSKGDYDFVKDVLAKQGQISFWTVRMKPGKPLAFGVIEGDGKRVPHLGLPGYPVSSMITFEVLARPAILKMMGKKNLSKPMVTAIVENRVENTDGRRVFARAVVRREGDRYHAHLSGPQGSGILTSMARANGLLIVPEDVDTVEEGEMVEVIMLDWSED